MKKNLLLLICLLICGIQFSIAQSCTPDLSITQPGIYPDATTNFPQGYAGVSYSTVIQFKVITDTVSSGTHVTVTDITMDSVSGLPPGFTYVSNPANHIFPGGSNACFTLNGNPALADTGTYHIVVHVTLHGVVLGFIHVSQSSTITGYRIVVNGAPEARFNADTTSVCAGNAVNFTDFSTDNPTIYQWSFPGGSPSSSSLKVPPPVIYTTPGNYNVSLTVYNPVGNHTKTKNGYITVNSSPTAAITANGPVTFCKGKDVTLSANTGSGLTYQWSSVYVPIQGATSDSYVAYRRGWFRVTVTNSNGCSAISNLIHVYVNSHPLATVSPSGSLSICNGQSITLTANAGVGLTYQWKKNNYPVQGATNISYIVTKQGDYNVKVIDINQCTNSSDINNIIVNSLPTASITASGPLTFCQGQSVNLTANSAIGFNYQWKKNNVNIAGETNQSYLAKKTGNYKVIVTNLNGCSKISVPSSVLVNCREDGSGNNLLSEYENSIALRPNPAASIATIDLNLLNAGNVSIKAFDLTGKLISVITEGNFEEGNHLFTFDVSAFEKGIYIISIKSVEGIKTIKLVVN
jgi:PKD repeat protein